MKKVLSFGIDKNGSFYNDEFDNIEKYFDEEGDYFSNVFLDEFECVVMNSICVDGMMDSLDFDNNGEEELKKLMKYVENIEKKIDYKNVIVLSFVVDFDDRWLIINKDDYKKLLNLCDNFLECRLV